jgi:hypothetical protein
VFRARSRARPVVPYHRSRSILAAPRPPPRHPLEPHPDLRPAAPHRPEPSAPIDQQAVAVDAQHAALDLVGTADRHAVAGADAAHGLMELATGGQHSIGDR